METKQNFELSVNIKMENGHQDNSEGNSESAEVDPYEKKYFALLKLCETTQQNNERLVNRLNHIKKMIRRLRHERRFLKRRLDKHEDEFRDIPLILPVDSGMDDDTNAGLLAAAQDYVPTAHQSNNLPARSPPSTALSSALLPQIDPGSPPPSLAMWSSKAGSSSTGPPSKKMRTGEKDKERGVNKTSQNPYFLFTQDQSSPAMEGYAQPSKISYDMYNGEKDVWLYGANEDLNHSNPVLLKDNRSSSS